MTDIKKIAYVIVFVRDMDRALRFYRDAVGLKVRMQSEHWTEFELEGTLLALHLADHFPPAAPPLADPGSKDVVNQEIVFHATDPFATRDALIARGVNVATPKLVHEAGPTMIGVSCVFEDPDNNILSVYGIVPRAAFETASKAR